MQSSELPYVSIFFLSIHIFIFLFAIDLEYQKPYHWEHTLAGQQKNSINNNPVNRSVSTLYSVVLQDKIYEHEYNNKKTKKMTWNE